MSILRRNHTANFTTVGNKLLDDERLKADEVGILVYLLSRPHDWEVRRSALGRRWSMGREAIRRVIRNLVRYGYCIAERKRLENGTTFVIYEIRDDPGPELTEEEAKAVLALESSAAASGEIDGETAPDHVREDDDPLTGYPSTVGPPPVDPSPAYIDIQNKDLTKNDSTQKAEREYARAREKRAANLVEFKRRWPTAPSDDQARIDHAWFELEPQEGEAALAGIGPFIAKLKCDKRTTVPAGWKYLKEKRWTLLAAAQAASAPVTTNYPRDSREARAILALFEIGGVTVPRHRRRSDGSIDYNHLVTPQLAALAEIPNRDAWVVLSRQQAAAWEALLREVLTVGVRRPIREGQHAPWPWPPGKDGKLYTGSTGPPLAGLSDQELADFK
jgi:hypothetical protein